MNDFIDRFIFVCDLNGKLIAQLIGVMLEPITCLKVNGEINYLNKKIMKNW